MKTVLLGAILVDLDTPLQLAISFCDIMLKASGHLLHLDYFINSNSTK